MTRLGSSEKVADTPCVVQNEPEVTPSWKRFAFRYAAVNVIIEFGAG